MLQFVALGAGGLTTQRGLGGKCRSRGSCVRGPFVCSSLPDEFKIPSAPILIPEGPWSVQDGGITAPQGFTASGMAAGLRASGSRADLSLVFCEGGATAAGVFTQNIVCAAPVTYCKKVLGESKSVKAILTNAGQANAATGPLGYQDAEQCAERVAGILGVSPGEVLLLSTGVIGQRIKLDQLLRGINPLVSSLGGGSQDALKAALAMTTTDLVSKSASLELALNGIPVRLGGCCKGSGMIHPNMATMLGIVTCDAPVDPDIWQHMLSEATKCSFNMITVDGDTSTNDTVLALTSGQAGIPVIDNPDSESGRVLQSAMNALMQGLAKAIAWDGEGATCLLEVSVSGAGTNEDAQKIAKSVASSSLTKAAVFGHDPNWGRIACAAGYSGVKFLQEDLRISLGDHLLMENGMPLEFDEKLASAYLKEKCDGHDTVNVSVAVGQGPGAACAWGCDLSYDYVKINAEYTT